MDERKVPEPVIHEDPFPEKAEDKAEQVRNRLLQWVGWLKAKFGKTP